MKAKQDYTMEEIDSMKEQLAESEWEGLKDRDKEYEETYLKQILWEGCVAWDNMEDEQVIGSSSFPSFFMAILTSKGFLSF